MLRCEEAEAGVNIFSAWMKLFARCERMAGPCAIFRSRYLRLDSLIEGLWGGWFSW